MIERERKFLVTGNLPRDVMYVSTCRLLTQGYPTPNTRVRLEQSGDVRTATLTVKHDVADATQALTREEYECPITEPVARALLRGLPTVSKWRTTWGRWDYDEFVGPEKLQLLEVELKRDDEDLPPFPPGLTVIAEVTHDPRYRNGNLVQELT